MSLIKRPPPAPSGFDEKTFFSDIWWHQKWEVFDGVFTPGRNPVSDLLSYAGVPDDLTGKTVLDIGAWNGCFSLECARRGATRVLGYGPDDPNTTGFFKLRDLLGYSNVDYCLGSVYDISSQEIGSFDVVLFFGVIYHLRYPLLALDKLYEVCSHGLFVESFVLDNHFLVGANHEPQQLRAVDERLVNTPIWEFFQYGELEGDTTNWFGPNLCALRAAVESAGFEVWHTHTWGHRAALGARKTRRQFLEMNSYESNRIIARSARLALP